MILKAVEKKKGQNQQQQQNYLLKVLRESTGECATFMFLKDISSISGTNLWLVLDEV